MRYSDDHEQYDYDYDELAENAEDLGLDEEPWMDSYEEEGEIPSYGRSYYPSIEDDED